MSTRYGAGLRWGGVTTAYVAVATVVHVAWYPRLVMAGLAPGVAGAIGGGVILAGVAWYVASRLYLHRGRAAGELVTDGPYALVRHPLYAAAVWLILPGVALVVRSWALAPAPLVAYVAIRFFLPAEERVLRARYGQAYDRYRRRTPALWPWPRPRTRDRQEYSP